MEKKGNQRIVIVGDIESSNDKQTKVRYEAIGGQRICYIPRQAMISTTKTSDGKTAFLIESCDLQHGRYDIHQQFADVRAPQIVDAEHIEAVEVLEHGEDGASEVLNKPMQPPTGGLFSIANGGANNDISDDDEEEWDDEVMPTNVGTSIEISTMDVGGNDPVWNGALTKGGRDELAAHDWRFEPVMKPLFSAIQENENMAPTFSPVNDAKGNPMAFGVFNPTYASEARPEGALLSTVSKDYFPVSYPTVFDPLLDMSAKHGWKASVTAYNEGGKARLDCDVSQATQSKKLAAQRLKDKGHAWISTDVFNETAKSLDGLYRYGFSVNNSLDGTRALSVQAVAMRVYCTNLAVMGNSQTIAALRHRKGVMQDRNWNSFATKVNDIIMDAQNSLIEMEFMQHIPVDVQLFERLMTLCETKGLMSWPAKKPDIVNGKQIGEKLTGGHMWRLAMDGWTKPQNEWVNVSDEQSGTLYHAYNVLNGAITHRPEWSDGKTTLKGRAVGFDTLNRRLGTVHNVMTDILHTAANDYRIETGAKKIGFDELKDFNSYIKSDGLGALNDIPMASEVLNI